MGDVVLECLNITKRFGGIEALHDVCIKVNQGECVGIIGPNGAGKTTLLNVVSGHMKPTKGRVKFMGRDITGRHPSQLVKMGIARTFQIVRVFKNMTVLENFQTVTDTPDTYLSELGLEGKKGYLAKELSMGELRKLNIGLVLATNPKLLLLDEPYSGLSPKEGAELSSLIRSLRDRGMTLVIVEHRLRELFDNVERVIVLNQGKQICDGTPEEVVTHSAVIEAYLGTGYEQPERVEV